MKVNALIILSFLFYSSSLLAQGESPKGKTYTYEEAVELLTAHEDEFQAKGALPEILTIGKQVHHARIKHNISLSYLSFVTGLSEETLIKIEEDKITPTRDILIKIEDLTGETIILKDY